MQITDRRAGRLAQAGTERQPGIKRFPPLLAALSALRTLTSFGAFPACPTKPPGVLTTGRSLAMTALTALSALFMGCAHGPSTARLGAAKGNFTTVLIDPGHGGKDSGGTSGRLAPFQREKDLTLDTAKRVRDELKRAGLHTLLTREDDHFIELDDRVAMANRLGASAILVSIHYNATGSSRPNGVQTFFWHANSHGLATRIQQAVVSSTGETNNGVTRRRLRLTRNPDIPCVLCECAYLTNPTENAKAAQASYRQLIANGIANGILQQYRLGDEGIPPVPEIWAPLSKASDKYTPTRKRKKHVHPSDEDARG